MRDEKDNCATCAPTGHIATASQIVESILLWDSPQNIRDDLHEMMLTFFMHYEAPPEEFKKRVVNSYTTLCAALKQMEQLQPNQRKEVCHVES